MGPALFAVAVVLASPAPAPAAAASPACPTEVDGLPLSVAVPFSGTARPVAAADGEIRSISLLCAYGEGVEASAEVRLTWSPGAADPCGTTAASVATGLDRQAFADVAAGLAEAAGGPCPPSPATPFPVGSAVAGVGAGVLLGTATLLVRRRRHRAPDDDPAVPPPEPGPTVEAEPTPVPTAAGPEPVRPDLRPVLTHLRTANGRAFARTGSGQWLTVAAIAYGTGHPEAGDVARTGTSAGRRPPRADVAVLAGKLAHHRTEDDR